MKKFLPGEPWFYHPDMACLEVDPDLFFSTDREGIAAAKRVCASCPLLAPCLQRALTNGEHGVWGGTSEDERMNLLKEQERSHTLRQPRRRRASRRPRVGSAA